MQRILTPKLCPDEVFHAAFRALAVPARRRPLARRTE